MPIIEQMKEPKYIELKKIYGSIEEQCEIIQSLVEIDLIRTKMKKKICNSYHFPTWGAQCQDPY